jgi:stalled ribosome alternative rescue factor ArfA
MGVGEKRKRQKTACQGEKGACGKGALQRKQKRKKNQRFFTVFRRICFLPPRDVSLYRYGYPSTIIEA